MVSAFISVGLSLLIIVVIRIWKILPPKIGLQNAITKQRRKATAIIVLGSGGHTGEMLRLSSQLDINKYIFHYIYAASDKRSIISLNSHDKLAEQPHKIHSIPRSREVYQSYFTSIFTTLYALLVSIYIVLRINPDLVLCNGPGTCVPICIAAYIPRVSKNFNKSILFPFKKKFFFKFEN
eukprot:gb/GECH01005028.1/.p1 GENE.gb/GECH01005028.1/~~gb/GECH01005028.1/.p1  ORF type:complete len:180 (+),score=10.50 gb/GECH01005028.1/:1-540(+)